MKLPLSFWVFAIAGFLAPSGAAGQQSEEMGGGKRQDLTLDLLTLT